MSKRKYPVVNIGSASMLVIFIILCLVTFSVLSLASSNNDYAYTEKIANRTASYYEASNRAEDILAQIDSALLETYRIHGDAYLTEITDILGNLDELDCSDFPSVSYSVQINDTQALYVALTLQVPENETDPFYTISSWKEVSTEEWVGDNTFDLMKK